MKLAIFLTLGLAFNALAEANAQKITLNVKNTPLGEVMREFQKQQGYSFLFHGKHLPDIRIDAQLRQVEFADAMDMILTDRGLDWSLEDGIVTITKRRSSPVANRPITMPQQRTITGNVSDNQGNPLEGVTISVKGTPVAVTSDAYGGYRISIPESGRILVFSIVGFSPVERSVGDLSTIDVLMEATVSDLDEVVVVGYGVQRRETVTGSVSTVKGDELSIAPVASTSTTLAGRLPGLISFQQQGLPGADGANIQIRGFGSALVIVDGVEADFNSLDPNSIESISILKDASASIFGSRAGNGVILVTTKRGNQGEPVFTLNSTYTLQGVTRMLRPSNSGQYAELRSEGWLNSGQPPSQVPFTPEQIENYYRGDDPLYPNTDWYDVLIRDYAPQHQHNISVRGGTERVRYYGFLGYLDQETMWKKNGGGYSRYNFQSNVDARIQDNFTLQLDVTSTTEFRQYASRSQTAGGAAWDDYWNTLPIYPAYLPDPERVSFANGAGTGGAHVTTNRDIFGYNDGDQQNLRGALALNYAFKGIQGLSAKAFANYSHTYGSTKYFVKPVTFYTYDPGSDTYTLAGALGEKASLSTSKNQNRMITGQFSLNYNRKFGDRHDLSALMLYEIIDYYGDYLTGSRFNFLTSSIDQLFAGSTDGMFNDGAANEMGRKGVIGRINYSYDDTYLMETTLRADASAKFPATSRWGYFPSVSLGWRVNKEAFLASVEAIDELKWRASYGTSGNDGVGNFQYLSGYTYGQTYVLGSGAQQGLVSTGLPNPTLTWEKLTISNVGFDFSFWQRQLYGSMEGFYRNREGIPATRLTSLPSTFGANMPPENLNSQNSRGFELELGNASSLGDFIWDVSGNISWARAKWGHYEEPEYIDEVEVALFKVSGQWVDRQLGYLSDGLFTQYSQIEELPFDQDNAGNSTLRPGDIRYKDLNGDGRIDYKDQTDIGKGTIPKWMMGLRSTLKYKGLDAYFLFQGAMGYHNYVRLDGVGLLSPAAVYDLRWTPVNNDPHALVPRIGGAPSNAFFSDYYLKKAGYLRLKVLSVGYSLPKTWLNAVGFTNLRVYFAGTNLLTFDRLKAYGIDPESPSGNGSAYYPQQRTFSFGLSASL
ncbi:SusC/RagA family TonB-linked outer membrane protein [Parapedobacter sp. 2B3]|uniref:SusC/RagA family TonB-linked outer membrane protein n=1 Tax=Parapedobacter sp. 2B3 TaxID=3342381 RepID=UPI0035B5DD38